jgi:hypothetical protein
MACKITGAERSGLLPLGTRERNCNQGSADWHGRLVSKVSCCCGDHWCRHVTTCSCMSANACWTLWTLTVSTALLVAYPLCVFCVSKRCTLLKCCLSWHVWTVHSYVRYYFVLTHLFMSITCSFFVVIQPSVCLPLSLSVTINFFATYDRRDYCPIWRFLLTMISRERFLLENSSFYIFVLRFSGRSRCYYSLFSHTLPQLK